MVNCRFIGRLGNSLFQVAATLAYAKRWGYQWGVPDNQRESSILTHWPELPRCNNHFPDFPSGGYGPAYFNFWQFGNAGDNITMAGYFQSEKFFENAKKEVKELFALPVRDYAKDYVSIHVRRGDYVIHNGAFPPVDPHYIREAMNTITMATGFNKFMFFSDDLAWCKQNFDYPNNTFVNEPNEKEALAIMASCSHHIIANSTFSWWSAYLGHNPNRIVISPSSKNWFGRENPNYNPKDIIPETWIQIEW